MHEQTILDKHRILCFGTLDPKPMNERYFRHFSNIAKQFDRYSPTLNVMYGKPYMCVKYVQNDVVWKLIFFFDDFFNVLFSAQSEFGKIVTATVADDRFFYYSLIPKK